MATDSEVYQAYWNGRAQYDKDDLQFRKDDLAFRRQVAADTKANDDIRNAQIIKQTQAQIDNMAAIVKDDELDQLTRCVAMTIDRYKVSDPWRTPAKIADEARQLQREMKRVLAIPL